MRIDLVSVFPAYFDALSLSLPGRAQREGLVDVAVHDLRAWTHDRHRTVDDTPYGGGAGMVMRPEPWGECLDELLAQPSHPDGATVLVVPTPAGERFTQRTAAQLVTAGRLVVACGRYEGIDQRVVDDAADRPGVVVREISLGDYVLNGGEVAALAICEAVLRLLPGFMGNADSLAEESHGEAGLLEAPVFTRPPTWRGRAVPDVLLSGDHARVAAWRHEQSVQRTALRRPDLLRPADAVDDLADLDVRTGERADAGELYTLQRACWLAEAEANPELGIAGIPALAERLEDVRSWLAEDSGWTTLVARTRVERRLVAAARGRAESGRDGVPASVWNVGRLMVAPDLQGRGIGRALLAAIEAAAPPSVRLFSLFTGEGSVDNQRMYRRAGYRLTPGGSGVPGAVLMTRPRRGPGR